MDSSLHQSMEKLAKVISPLRCAFFISTNDLLGPQCFFSTLPPYKSDQYYSIYELPALGRILLKKDGAISPLVENELHRFQENIICRVIEWTPYAKSFLFIDVSEDIQFDESSFFSIMQDVEWLQIQFDKIYMEQRALL